MGGIKFILGARAELTPEEAQNVKTYDLGGTMLWNMESINPAAAEAGFLKRLTKTYTIFIRDLTNGTQIECKDIAEMLSHEAALKDACETFKAILDAAAKFGGEEVIEIGAPKAA